MRITFNRAGLKIRGHVFGKAPHPQDAVILSHGFMANERMCQKYAKLLAEMGFLTVTFDFCGGGIFSRSDGLNEIDKELEKEFCAEIDSIFDSDVSSKAFKYVPPLAMVTDENGECEMYIMLVLKALAVEIQKYGDKMNNATNKYTQKYAKNK